MGLKIQEIQEIWSKDKPNFEKLGTVVVKFIRNRISEYEIMPEVTFRVKELLSIIKKIKKKQLKKNYSYKDINDKLGIRIICVFQEEMEIIDTFIKHYFLIDKVEKKRDILDFDRLDYISNHYDARINIKTKDFKKFHDLDNLVFEIQVRTLNQHAWSNSAHSLSYKQEAEISNSLKRKIYRLLSLYEIADDEISSVNQSIISDPSNRVYNLLRKLEGKIYKFANVDYDREIALNNIKILLDYFSQEEVDQVNTDIERFIAYNSVRINAIFKTNKFRYHEIPLLTQPEIFIIWYALNKFSFSKEDNWSNDFDPYDLDQIKTLWGL